MEKLLTEEKDTITFGTKNIFVFGTRGFGSNYGGWETFTYNLILNYPSSNHRFFFFEPTHDKKQEGIFRDGEVFRICVFVPKKKGIKMMVLDYKSINILFRLVDKYKIKGVIAFFLGPKIGGVIKLRKWQFKKRNISIIENPAGLEWKRTKWNRIIRLYMYFESIDLAKSTDCLVCDSKAIGSYYRKKIGDKKRIEYIPYGSYVEDSVKKINNSKILLKLGLENDGYFLVLCRFVPENNIEMIINGYLNAKTKKKLLIVANIDKEYHFFRKVNHQFSKKIRWENVIFSGSIYNQDDVYALRSGCCAYIHGHSVGGTNPGLLESMSIVDINYLFDCPFTREVGGDCVYYFSNSYEMSVLFDLIVPKQKRYELGQLCKNRMRSLYSWDMVCRKYYSIFESFGD